MKRTTITALLLLAGILIGMHLPAVTASDEEDDGDRCPDTCGVLVDELLDEIDDLNSLLQCTASASAVFAQNAFGAFRMLSSSEQQKFSAVSAELPVCDVNPCAVGDGFPACAILGRQWIEAQP